jgi:RNA polymerase sigma-70 factor (sigma-E family)
MQEPGTLREFMIARGAALSRTAYLLTGRHDQAQDLLQSTLANVIPRWSRIVDGDPEAYIRRAMYHERISIWRRRRYVEQSMGELPDRSTTVAESDTAVLRVVVEQALARLTARQRAVVVLRYYEDRSESETARILGCALGTVKSQNAKALAKLREVAPELLDLVRRPKEGSR